MKNKLLILTLLVLVFISCKYKTSAPVQTSNLSREDLTETHTIETEKHNLTLLAAGDNLFHITIINNFRRGNTHDFSPIYSEIKPLIQAADLAFVNQETVMAGTEFGYSGFPLFNTPQSLARTLADTGFDIINIANNHAMDMGRAGLYNTLDLLDSIEEFTVIGARKTGDSKRIITKNNITLGFLSYTFSLNGIALPQREPNLVSMIKRDIMTQELNELRPLCDFLVVSIHWGAEYLLQPDASQKDLALFLAEHNVDLIIGHHPHVLQPVENLPRPDGKETLCFYSLGNFVSNQREKERILGALMLVTFSKTEDDLYISNSGLIPVVCHIERNFTNTKVYPLYSYTQEILKKHFLYEKNKMDFGFFNSILFKLGTKLIMYNIFAESSL
ncbi:MAG: CapA family protein [Treponema sp.]|jgi:poly-gamma-glutamate synthesis protein (capsule biosynthesis protein)|nr:CapA family protein [Treponema sp.]